MPSFLKQPRPNTGELPLVWHQHNFQGYGVNAIELSGEVLSELIARDSYGKLEFKVGQNNQYSDRDLPVLEVSPLYEFQEGVIIEILGEHAGTWRQLYAFQGVNAWHFGGMKKGFKGFNQVKRFAVCLEHKGASCPLLYQEDGWREFDPTFFAGKIGKIASAALAPAPTLDIAFTRLIIGEQKWLSKLGLWIPKKTNILPRRRRISPLAK